MLALVTGGNRGIGFAIAHKLAENGMDVIIVARNKQKLKSAKVEIEKLGAKCWALQSDISKKDEIKRLRKEILKIGELDILINNAGVAFGKEVLENSEEEIDQMLEVNLRGLIYCTKAFLPQMVKKGSGIIINISSGAGKTAYPGLAVYCSTKFGVIGFTQGIAQEVEEQGVRVYAICPADTQTDMWESLYPGVPANYVPEDVAIEVMELVEKNKRIKPGREIDVRKHV